MCARSALPRLLLTQQVEGGSQVPEEGVGSHIEGVCRPDLVRRLQLGIEVLHVRDLAQRPAEPCDFEISRRFRITQRVVYELGGTEREDELVRSFVSEESSGEAGGGVRFMV